MKNSLRFTFLLIALCYRSIRKWPITKLSNNTDLNGFALVKNYSIYIFKRYEYCKSFFNFRAKNLLIMKKIYLFFLTLTLSLSVYAQNSSVIDTAYSDDWENGTWTPDTRSYNSYDQQCRVTETILQTLDSVTGATWLNSGRILYSYLANNSLSKTVTQVWDTATNDYTTAAEMRFVYTSFNKLDSSIAQACAENVCINIITTYAYNAQQLLDSSKTETTVPGFTSTTTSKYTYGNSGRIMEINVRSFNSLTNTSTLGRTQHTYDNAGNLTRTVTQGFQDPSWVNQVLDTLIYNSANKQIESLSKTWDVASASWVNSTHILYSYNAAGQQDQVVSQSWDAAATNWVNENRQRYTYKSCSSTLPLTLLKFSAVKDRSFARLNWKTTSEVNISHFIIERSGSNSGFEPIGKVFPVTGNSSEKNYNYEDDLSKLSDANVFYRIKIVDADGTFTYTNVEHINFENTAVFTLYPNPVSNSLRINGMGTFSVELYNSTGKLNLAKVITGGNGNIDVSRFASGVYWLKIKDQKGSIDVKKVIVK